MSLENILASLTPEEKLNAMDILWRDLSENPTRLSSPDWHGDVLAHRIANPSRVPRLPIDVPFDEFLTGMLAEAGLSENPYSLGPLIGLLVLFLLVVTLVCLLLQRIAEFLIGRRETSIRELLYYTAVVALLSALLTLLWRAIR